MPKKDIEVRRINSLPRDKRTQADVDYLRSEGAVFGGCCDRFADNSGCDCMAVASDAGEATVRPDDIRKHTGSKYVKEIKSCLGDREIIGCVDVYSVADAFRVTSMPLNHALKKILMPGARGKGTWTKDIEEAIDALKEALKLGEPQ